jgi:hypothetical protein
VIEELMQLHPVPPSTRAQAVDLIVPPDQQVLHPRPRLKILLSGASPEPHGLRHFVANPDNTLAKKSFEDYMRGGRSPRSTSPRPRRRTRGQRDRLPSADAAGDDARLRGQRTTNVSPR